MLTNEMVLGLMERPIKYKTTLWWYLSEGVLMRFEMNLTNLTLGGTRKLLIVNI